MSDEEAIRDLILRWAVAVHTGDLKTVLADHDPNIAMFDVPPPYNGIRGIDAYRESWPPFFEWQRQVPIQDRRARRDGRCRRGVRVRAGALRHARGLRGEPRPLRMTIGLRKRDGHWVVTHEHHSFPMVD
jgi:ketosteroid isomerase-like protein